jgi:hypothetical protein
MISDIYLRSSSAAAPLRIGVFIDGFRLSRAFRQVLIDIQSSNFARLELVVLNCQPNTPAASKSRFSRRLRLLLNSSSRQTLLYSAYQKWDQRNAQHPHPLEEVDVTALLGHIPRLDVVPITKRFVHRFPPQSIAALRAQNLDVLLRFGFNILRGEVLQAARFGIWSFHHGDNDFYRGGPAMFWEVVENNPCSGVILQVLSEKLDDGYVLCKSLFATVPGISRNRNVFEPFWGTTHLVIRKLRELHECGWDSIQEHALPAAEYQGRSAIYRAPTNFQMLKWLAPKMTGKLIARPFRRDTIVYWRIALRRSDSRLLTDPGEKFAGYKWLASPRGHFYADPFLFEHQGQVWIFFEDYLYAAERGRIACAAVQPDLSIGPVIPCLDLPQHLSYPAVFHHDGAIYMIPESSANNTVDLYRAVDFPAAWKYEKTLFRQQAVDTTPLYRDGRWYFFTTLCETPGAAVFGALFSSNELTGAWAQHSSSPISTDVRVARSAGAIQQLDGRLFRIVQDCSENYGRRLHVREILELTSSSYRERHIRSVEPDWEKGLRGVHTYAFCNGIEAVDAMSFQPRRSIL